MSVPKKLSSYFLTDPTQADLNFWKRNNPATINRIAKLIDAIMADPFAGIGKPKPLKYSLEGYWSRRIDSEHRIIYRISGNTLEIIALRGHYE
jgi:toxin YoeB